MNARQAVILAGGLGTRLRERLGDLPKPMIPIAGRPLLEHQLRLCRQHGVTDVRVLAGYKAEVLAEFCGDGSRWGLRVRCVAEEQPRGTAGAVLAAWPDLAERFLVLYGDVMLNVDLGRMWSTHEASGAAATLLLHPNDHPRDSDLVEVDEAGWITAFWSRPHAADRWYQNLVNAALYVLEREALSPWLDLGGRPDFGQDLFPAMLARGARLRGYRSTEYIKDIGTPGRYDRVEAEYGRGVVARGTWAIPQPAVFLDRDGTLNVERGGVTRAEDFALLPGVGEAIRALNHAGLKAVVVTNQPVLAKGQCDEAELGRIHRKLETLLGEAQAFLDRIYVCPHHPERGWPGERPALKVACGCRKPGVGLIRQAARELNLDLGRSWLVGDSTTDLLTARRAGLKALLLRTGHGGRDGRHAVQADRVFDDLPGAVEFIVQQAGEGEPGTVGVEAAGRKVTEGHR